MHKIWHGQFVKITNYREGGGSMGGEVPLYISFKFHFLMVHTSINQYLKESPQVWLQGSDVSRIPTGVTRTECVSHCCDEDTTTILLALSLGSFLPFYIIFSGDVRHCTVYRCVWRSHTSLFYRLPQIFP